MNISPAYELRRDLASSCSDNPWAIRNPLDEARDLYRMVIHGSCTVESIRELIAVAPHIESALLAYADHYPKDGDRIRCVLQFRRKVGVEFERLIQCDMSFIEGSEAHAEEDAEEVEADVAISEFQIVASNEL